MEKNIEVSYCIVTFNSADKICKIIDNLESMTPKIYSFTIYVVDNGSTDETVALINKEKSKYRNVELIVPARNKGFGAGNNMIMDELKSKYHILVNPDISIRDPKQIEIMVNYLESNKEIGLLSPKILNTDGTVQKLYKYNPSVLDMGLRFISPKIMKKRQQWFVHDETGYTKTGKIEYASGAFMVFRTEIFKQVSGFDERYFMYMEDADITRKVNSVSQAQFFPQAEVFHEWQRENHKKLKYTMITIFSMIKYFNKWGWKIW
ncbi:glycosyltransferase family 2 protein [Lactiplantibacillus plantarum]|uniref:glycosyltransferase family 2 protein n=1 Tax=Lactiplantibacillus plantarum TaxID=1590 RepID=UPI000C7EF782|nr:glycosyltransferase family 2 protein [Lactiplantibacillus plantarum]